LSVRGLGYGPRRSIALTKAAFSLLNFWNIAEDARLRENIIKVRCSINRARERPMTADDDTSATHQETNG